MFYQEEYCNDFELEPEQYHKGYQNVVNDLQRKLNLRNRDVVVNKERRLPNHPSSSQQNKEKQKEDVVKKNPENKNRNIKRK